MAVLSAEIRIGSDPEMRYTPNGVAVTSCRGAMYAGKKLDEKLTTWVNLVFWNGLAEDANLNIKKGMLIGVEGKLKPARVYQDKKTGEYKASQEIEVEEFGVLKRERTYEKISSYKDHVKIKKEEEPLPI